jgi:hypothetical protein
LRKSESSFRCLLVISFFIMFWTSFFVACFFFFFFFTGKILVVFSASGSKIRVCSCNHLVSRKCFY